MIDPDDVRKDMVTFAPSAHDLRVARGDWVYYVRAVRRGTRLAAGAGVGDDPLGLVLLLPLAGVWSWGQRRARWKAGVVRVPASSGWQSDRARVVHKELASHALPVERIAELADDVRRGRFDG